MVEVKKGAVESMAPAIRAGEKVVELPKVGLQSFAEGVDEMWNRSERPCCKECKRGWRYPRNLSHVHKDTCAPRHIKPTTKSTVVCHLNAYPGSSPPSPIISENVFKHINFTWNPGKGCVNMPHKLVEDFWYDMESGEVTYDYDPDHQSDLRQWRYARLITLNSWYKQLLRAFILVGCSILDYYSNFLLIMRLIDSDPSDADRQIQQGMGRLKWPFICGWLFMVLVQCIWSVVEANTSWKYSTSERIGDLISHTGKSDTVVVFAALVFFIFFNVEGGIWDMPIKLHPWKSVQPFAAIKAEGTRCFVVGYKSREMYNVETRAGQFNRTWTQLVLNSMVFSSKLWVSIWYQQYSVILSCCTSFPTLCLGWSVWLRLFLDRQVMWRRLTKDVTKKDHENELERREREAAIKLRQRFFMTGKSLKRELADSGFVQSNVGQSQGMCPSCGRDENKLENLPKTNIQVGGVVQLSHDYELFHDSRHGPLEPEKPLRVIRVGPDVVGMGRRALVAPMDEESAEHDMESSWWLDVGALMDFKPTPESPLHRAMNSSGNTGVPLLPGAPEANGDDGSLLVKDVDAKSK